MKTFLMMFLAATSTAKITTKPLQDVTVFAENLGETKLYHQIWKVIVVIDNPNLYDRLHQVDTALEYAQDQCEGDCFENAEIKLLTGRLDRLKLLYSYLYHILGYSRQKRGLINGIGVASKALFGTLDENDLILINENMDQLFKDNTRMSQSIGNQTIVIRNLLNSASHDIQQMNSATQNRLDELNRLVNATNRNQQNMHLANQLLGCTISIEENSEDTNLLINAINDGKHGIVHPKLLAPKQLIEELKKLEKEQNLKYPVRLVEYNYQHIIDISDLSVTIIDKRLTYCLQVPILEPETLRSLHLIPIPKPHGKTFVAAVPTHEIILDNQENSFYVPSDGI